MRAVLDQDGVDVNIKNDNGNTALICASIRGHLDVVRALLDRDRMEVDIQN